VRSTGAPPPHGVRVRGYLAQTARRVERSDNLTLRPQPDSENASGCTNPVPDRLEHYRIQVRGGWLGATSHFRSAGGVL